MECTVLFFTPFIRPLFMFGQDDDYVVTGRSHLKIPSHSRSFFAHKKHEALSSKQNHQKAPLKSKEETFKGYRNPAHNKVIGMPFRGPVRYALLCVGWVNNEHNQIWLQVEPWFLRLVSIALALCQKYRASLGSRGERGSPWPELYGCFNSSIHSAPSEQQ
jgi:hypothetical protein